MSMIFQEPINWRPAEEVLSEDEAAFQGSVCIYTERVYPSAVDGMRPPPPLFPVKDLSEQQWKQEQEYRLLAPIGTRSLLRRRFHESVTLGTVIQDTVLVRVDAPYQWLCAHAFYTETEESPLPILTKKRKFAQA
jgi:hypothetical protein